MSTKDKKVEEKKPLLEQWQAKKPFSIKKGAIVEKEINFIDDENLGVLSEDMKDLTASVLQNTEDLIKDTLNESSATVGDVATFIDMLLPMVRRSIGRTDLLEVVGVQQLSKPDDYIFIEKAYFSGKGDASASNYYDANGDPTVYAITTDGDTTFYNSVKTVASGEAGSDITNISDENIGKILYKEVTFDGRNAFLVKVNQTDRAIPSVGTDVKIEGTTVNLTSKVEGSVGRATLFQNYIEQFDRGVSQTLTEFNEVSITIKKKLVQAKDRVLAFRYDVNMLTDIMRQFGVAGKKRVVDMIVYEYSLESNKKIFNLLMTSALSVSQFTYATAGGNNARPMDKYDELQRKILKEQAAITARNNIGNANKMVTSINIASILSQTPSWKSSNKLTAGIYKAGTWKGMDVYVNTTLPTNYDFVWLGTKVPGNPFKAPAFVSMYVPLFITMTKKEANPLNEIMLFVERNSYDPMPDNPTDFGTQFTVDLAGSPYIS